MYQIHQISLTSLFLLEGQPVVIHSTSPSSLAQDLPLQAERSDRRFEVVRVHGDVLRVPLVVLVNRISPGAGDKVLKILGFFFAFIPA